MTAWTLRDIPPQHGRTAIVTGTGGIGFEDALALARAGADVIIAGRNEAKGREAVARIRAAATRASVSFEALDLADLASVARFAARMQASRERVDLLVNNAAVMALPQRRLSADGHEMQFATNYLGHFALTARLLPLLRAGRGARVISLSSVAARQGTIAFDNLQAERRYRPMTVYSQTKLACLMFAFELQRRSDAHGWGITSIAAHPGIARTELVANGAGMVSLFGAFRVLFSHVFFQSAAQGALPTLFAATAPDAKPGGYYGPDRMNEIRGNPGVAVAPKKSLDTTVAARLWEISAQLAQVRFA